MGSEYVIEGFELCNGKESADWDPLLEERGLLMGGLRWAV